MNSRYRLAEAFSRFSGARLSEGNRSHSDVPADSPREAAHVRNREISMRANGRSSITDRLLMPETVLGCLGGFDPRP